MHRTHKSNEKSEQTFGKSKERRKKLFKKSPDFLNSFFLRSIYSNVLFRNVTI